MKVRGWLSLKSSGSFGKFPVPIGTNSPPETEASDGPVRIISRPSAVLSPFDISVSRITAPSGPQSQTFCSKHVFVEVQFEDDTRLALLRF